MVYNRDISVIIYRDYALRERVWGIYEKMVCILQIYQAGGP